MNKRTKALIINLLPIVCVIGLCAWLTVRSVIYLNAPISSAIILALCGAAVCYVLSLFIHELGHLAVARSAKMKVEFVNFGLLSIEYGTITKINWFTFFGQNAGESCFIPRDKATVNSIRLLAQGGLVASLLLSIIWLVLLFTIKSPTLYAFICAGGCAAPYLFIVNLMPFDKSSDGSLLFGSKKHIALLAECSNISREINGGDIPVESEIISNGNEPLALYFHYMFTVANKGCDEAIKVLTKMPLCEELTDDEYEMIYPELIYAEYLKGAKFDHQTVSEAESFFSKEGTEPAFYRAHAVFRLAQGDKTWAESLLITYNSLMEKAAPFTTVVEKTLMPTPMITAL